MKFLMLALEVGELNLKPFIVEASQIISVIDQGNDSKKCFKIKLKDTDEVCYCTHLYKEPCFTRIENMYAFLEILKELS